jgi:hypothetical protein
MTHWFDAPAVPGDNSIRFRLTDASPEQSNKPLPPMEKRPWDRLAVEQTPVPSMTPLPTTPPLPSSARKKSRSWRQAEDELRPQPAKAVEPQKVAKPTPATPLPAESPPKPREMKRVAEQWQADVQAATVEPDPQPIPVAAETSKPEPATDEPTLADAAADATADEDGSKLAAVVGNPPALDGAVPKAKRTVAQVPKRYQARMANNKSEVVKRRGGSANTEAAVRDALAWLAKHQDESGCWVASKYGAGKGQLVDGRFRGTAGVKADTGITGLALLALLGDGNTHQQGKYKKQVAAGLEYLMRQQREDGNLCGAATNYSRMYCHGIASLALAEGHAMSGDERLRPFVEKAVRYTISCQNPTTGGWRYNPGDAGDTSQMGWQLMFLTTAEQGGIRIPDYVKSGMLKFLRSVSVGANYGLASYRAGQGVTQSMTAEALVCRVFLGATTPALEREAADFISSDLPGYGRPNLYYWYYATLGLSQTDASAWRNWNSALQHQLLTTQKQRGDNRGSWSSETVWGGHGGRVYSTALAAMCLEVYYRYPLPSKEVARRPR